MPTYIYRREDGSTFEIEQRITEDALTTCPTTGQPVKRVITGGTGLIFKGSGFYQTDYARNVGNGKADKTKSSTSTDTADGSGDKSTTASDSSTETKAASSEKSE